MRLIWRLSVEAGWRAAAVAAIVGVAFALTVPFREGVSTESIGLALAVCMLAVILLAWARACRWVLQGVRVTTRQLRLRGFTWEGGVDVVGRAFTSLLDIVAIDPLLGTVPPLLGIIFAFSCLYESVQHLALNEGVLRMQGIAELGAGWLCLCVCLTALCFHLDASPGVLFARGMSRVRLLGHRLRHRR